MFCFHGVLVSPGSSHIYYANKLHTVLPSYIHVSAHGTFTWSHTLLMLPGEDMTLEGRRQLALFLVRKYSIVIYALNLSVYSCFSRLV